MSLKPPKARKIPHEIKVHGHTRIDDYYWLNERENPEVIQYLEEENNYLNESLKEVENLKEDLYQEIKGRIKKEDESVPYPKDGYFHYYRFEKGKEYAIICRKEGSLESPEEILIDENALAEGHEYFSLREYDLSTDQSLMAYSIDTVGRRIYQLHFKDLASGEKFDEIIEDCTGNVCWANDNKTVFYSKQDPETLRSHQIWKHKIGTHPSQDVLVFEEEDETFSCYINKTKSNKYLIISSFQTVSTESRILEADNPDGQFRVFLERERDHEYSIDHFEDKFLVLTNWDALNFRLMETPEAETGIEHWKERIAHREGVLMEDVEIFKDFLVIEEREDGLTKIVIEDLKTRESHYVDFGESVYTSGISVNEEFDTELLRFSYTSLTTPPSTFDYNMKTREKTLKKEMPVLGGFNKSEYSTERIYAKAEDGTSIPISLVFKKDLFSKGKNPCVLYGYGSYGATIDPVFNSARLSVLNRGFVFAIAHVRGGQLNGRQWYEDGKLLKKKNTFTDFIDCGKHLIKEGFSREDGLYAVGGSAGGLLMGAVANMAPEIFKGIIAQVPFVDVVTTMLDDSIPLTTGEYDEWGDPNQKEFYEYILSYSPYDNVEEKEYPNMLITTGLHDSQVQYWEPAKWVAKLRELKKGDQKLFLYTNMAAGHGGASGRFQRFKEVALEYVFFCVLEGIKN